MGSAGRATTIRMQSCPAARRIDATYQEKQKIKAKNKPFNLFLPAAHPCPTIAHLPLEGDDPHFSVVLPIKCSGFIKTEKQLNKGAEVQLSMTCSYKQFFSYPIRGSTWEDVPHYSSTVATSGYSETKASSIIAKFNHLHLSPVTLQLRWHLLSLLIESQVHFTD